MYFLALMSMHSCTAQPVKLRNFGTNYFAYFLIKLLKIEICKTYCIIILNGEIDLTFVTLRVEF